VTSRLACSRRIASSVLSRLAGGLTRRCMAGESGFDLIRRSAAALSRWILVSRAANARWASRPVPWTARTAEIGPRVPWEPAAPAVSNAPSHQDGFQLPFQSPVPTLDEDGVAWQPIAPAAVWDGKTPARAQAERSKT
jgi:hypothetical protein